ncbi:MULTISPECIES: long-chain-fatty-acid--CoA ligase [unclassified Burkholderia]|uniref:long-chain-fatty-acid--CoA ligase n=1 Tax=unclassified Burkholderia TaxID=2613784 RepID=UPI002ABE74AF|nr:MULTISPECIES: long-chain-fatty-acid--CoA ligase [unclassified Burkholderia]
MQSTMQAQQLGVPLLLRHIQRVTGRSRVYTPEKVEGVPFSAIAERAGRLANALGALGCSADAVVGTLCAATQEHLEAYLGVPGSGRVLHTINVRLHDDQIEYVINHGGDVVIVCDAAHAVRLIRILPKCPTVKIVILVGATPAELPSVPGVAIYNYEELLAEATPQADWPDVKEDRAAIACYTGGTTGMPKGVAYSHRSLWLQAMSLCTANSLAIGAATRILPAVPLYHVNGWGIPFAALMAGAEMVLPGQSLHAKDLLALIERHAPTLAAGVPTIWADVLELVRSRGKQDLGAIKAISCGGAPVPTMLASAYAEMGIDMHQAWGMTETSSMSAICKTPPWATSDSDRAHYRATQGRVVCGLEVRVVEIGGGPLPNDGKTVGEIQIRGSWVTASYLGSDDRENFDGDWLRTGDLGTLDADGYVCLSDRAKDAIKSGGEWIPSLALEEAIRSHPSIEDVAVVAVEDPRWQERPAAVIVLKSGASTNSEALSSWLQTVVARWWVPSQWVVTAELPRTSVGKIDKKLIRQKLSKGEFESC